jgi:hypothetical protein
VSRGHPPVPDDPALPRGHALEYHSGPEAFARALAGLSMAPRLRGVRTPEFETSLAAWHLANMVTRRLAHPFRYQYDDWPARVKGMVAAPEAVAA